VVVTDEIQQMKETLSSLAQRLEDLSADAQRNGHPDRSIDLPVDDLATPAAPDRALATAAEPLPPERSQEPAAGEEGPAPPPDLLAILRAGASSIDAIGEIKEMPRFFAQLARRLGLRCLLLKRWKTGLQVIRSEGVTLPEEACRKRRDGRAPIPLPDDQFFSALTEECTVYAGPVPVRHFPLDLTIMLGRGSRDRQIVVMPLPAKDHWNLYIYMDIGRASERALGVADILACYALARIRLMRRGEPLHGTRVRQMLRQELARRREGRQRRLAQTSWLDQGAAPAGGKAEAAAEDPPADATAPVEAPADATPACAPPQADGPAVDAGDQPPAAAQGPVADAEPDGGGQAGSGRRTPEAILRHSGELPALPRAACHILAVIDDPKTTATRLEKAIALDQALTAKVLRIANSPFYGAMRDIHTVSEAIVRLGFVTIRNWTLVAATRSVFLTPGSGLVYKRIWRQSVLSAMASQVVAQAVRHTEPEAVFLGGLMQNIGQLVLARADLGLFHEIVEKSIREHVPYHIVERNQLGFDHGELGALLIGEWNLSPRLEEAVRYHHRLEGEVREKRVAAMIAVGEEVALCTGGDETLPVVAHENSHAARVLGITAEMYGQLQEKAKQLNIDPQFFS
jgi:HD-like signal output (HDOD) protein